MLDANDRTVTVTGRVARGRGTSVVPIVLRSGVRGARERSTSRDGRVDVATAAGETDIAPTGGPECPLTS